MQQNQLARAERLPRSTRVRMTQAARKRRISRARKAAFLAVLAELIAGVKKLPDKAFRFSVDMCLRAIILLFLTAGVWFSISVFLRVLELVMMWALGN